MPTNAIEGSQTDAALVRKRGLLLVYDPLGELTAQQAIADAAVGWRESIQRLLSDSTPTSSQTDSARWNVALAAGIPQ